jgi:hypothetical protein
MRYLSTRSFQAVNDGDSDVDAMEDDVDEDGEGIEMYQVCYQRAWIVMMRVMMTKGCFDDTIQNERQAVVKALLEPAWMHGRRRIDA